MEEVKNMKKEEKIRKKEEKKRLKAEKKANKKPMHKMKLAKIIIASLMIVLMLFSICGTLIFYLINM